MINTITLPPFKKMCVTIGNLPTSFVESMSYYEALCWMYNYLDKTVIPAINTEGEAITELQTAFTTLKNYVDNYFENLDVQEEINNKLDAMAEAGTLTDIIAQYLGLAGVLAFNTVADMKSAENLANGSTAKTLGYHSLNDGGSASYKIRTITNDDVVDEMFIIELSDNTLVAELIYNEKVNVKQLGAYGDNTHDDTTVLQAALTSDKPLIIPKGTYLTSSSLNITNKGSDTSTYTIDGIDAKISYSGINYAINIQNVANSIISIGYINSPNGGNIQMTASSYSDFIQYLTFNFKVMTAKTGFDNVYAETTGDGWINEITWNGGRFYGSSTNNFHLKYGCNNWNFNNIGFEGGYRGVYFENSNAEHSMGHYTFIECRHEESISEIIKADGWVKDVFIYYAGVFKYYLVTVNSACTNWRVVASNDNGSILIDGKWFLAQSIKTLEGGLNAQNSLNLNDLKTPGDYNFVTAQAISSASNFPPTTRQGKLTVEKFSNYYNSGDASVVQTYVTKIGERFTRAFLNSNWLRWIKNTDIPSIYLTANTDLNTCTAGSYYCDSHAVKITLTNTPADLGDIFRLDIELIGDITTSRIQQTIHDTLGGIYTRVYNGASWTAWKSL